MKVRRNKALMLMAIGITAILLPILMAQTKVDNAHKSNKGKASTTEKEEIVSTRVNENRGLVDKYGIPTETEGNLSNGFKSTDPVDMAFEYFQNNQTIYKIDDARKEFRLEGYSKDEMVGDFHVKLLQIVNGVRVRYGQYMLRFDQTGQLTRVYGQIDPEARQIDTNPAISEERAKEIAVDDTRKLGTSLENVKSAKLIIARADGILRLNWIVNVLRMDSMVLNMDYYIDAKTGVVLEKESRIRD